MRLLRPRQRVPTIWELLSSYLQLEAPLSRAWWTALERAQWSEARAFYQMLRLFEGRPGVTPDTVLRFVQQSVRPQHLISVLEGLVGERLLSRRKGTLLTEAVLRRVTREGQWK